MLNAFLRLYALVRHGPICRSGSGPDQRCNSGFAGDGAIEHSLDVPSPACWLNQQGSIDQVYLLSATRLR